MPLVSKEHSDQRAVPAPDQGHPPFDRCQICDEIELFVTRLGFEGGGFVR